MCASGASGPHHKPLVLTRHSERPPQASGVLLALFELHTANPDDLADQKQSLPHQVAAAQILEAQVKHLHQREDSETLKLTLNCDLQSRARRGRQRDSLTVNRAGRLLSFSISLGIPILSQRTRKFSL